MGNTLIQRALAKIGNNRRSYSGSKMNEVPIIGNNCFFPELKPDYYNSFQGVTLSPQPRLE
jgi:hypothetical protein